MFFIQYYFYKWVAFESSILHVRENISIYETKLRNSICVSFIRRFIISSMEYIDLVIYLSICLVVLPIGVVVNRKLYKNLKNEEHKEKGKAVQRIMKHYSILQCVAWPLLAIYVGIYFLLDVVFEVIDCSVALYCIFAFRIIYGLCRNYFACNSLIIAILRYVFLVFERQVESFGVRRLNILFISSSIGVPIFNIILYELTQPMEQVYISVLSDKIQYDDIFDNNTSLTENCSCNSYNFPIYLLFNSHAPQAIVSLMTVVLDIMLIVVYSNLIEGCIYAHLFIMHSR